MSKCHVKLSLLHSRSSKSKRTDSLRCSDHMAFNESFNFKLHPEDVSEVGVMLQLMESNIIGKGVTCMIMRAMMMVNVVVVVVVLVLAMVMVTVMVNGDGDAGYKMQLNLHNSWER